MPLSEQEQRLLDEMERHLLRNDADVVSAPDGGRSLSYRNVVYGTILVLAGLGALIVGIQTVVWVGVIGFVLMLGGVVLAVTPMRSDPEKLGGSPSVGAPRAAAPKASSFMDRMNDRWDRRQGDN